MDVITDYQALAAGLALTRRNMDELLAVIEECRGGLQDNPDYIALVEAELRLRNLRAQETIDKGNVSAALVVAFTRTGEKKYPGIGDIAIRRKVQYEDAPAIKWAVSAGMHALLKVDRSAADKAFEGLADNLDFVTVVEEPFARIASKIETETA